MFNDLFNNAQYGQMASAALDPSQAEALAKTMTIGHANGLSSPTSLVGGSALQMESIDGTLKSVTYDASHLQLWPALPQDRAYSLVEQYVRTNSYGDGGSPFIPEAGSPQMNDSEYNRHAQKVVFLATRRGVSLPSTLVKMNFGGDIESREAQAGTLWMLERLERYLYKGQADFSNAGEFDGAISAIPNKIQNLDLSGLEVQIRQGDADYTAQSRAFDGFGASHSVIRNIGGQVISESDIEDLANILLENYSHPSEMHLQPKNISDFVKQFYPKERVNTMGVLDGRAGYVVKTMSTTAGDIALKANIFLKPKDSPKSNNDRPGVPGAPTSATASAAAAMGSDLVSGDKYAYSVSACNEQGEGAAVVASAQVTVAASGDAVSLAIVQPTSGAGVTHYAVYRTSKQGAGATLFIGYVARSGSTTTFLDKGRKTQGSATGFMLDMNPEALVWKQLAPLTRLNLAQLSMSKEFILWLAGVLIVFKPRALGVFENVGIAAGQY